MTATAIKDSRIKTGLNKIPGLLYKYRAIYLMILPGMLYFIVFSYGPMYGLLLAFKKFVYNKGILGSPWVGLDNFRYVLLDSGFWASFKNTVIISAGKIIFGFPAPIILSLLLNELRSLKYKKFVQSILYIPHFFSWVIISGIFFSLLSSTSGVISKICISYLGFKMPAILGNPDYFRRLKN